MGVMVVDQDHPHRNSFLGLLLGIDPTILVLAAHICDASPRLIREGVAQLNKCFLVPYWTFQLHLGPFRQRKEILLNVYQ